MTEYERMLRHRALWIWLAENDGAFRDSWPGWETRYIDNPCFLCPEGIAINCDKGRSSLCANSIVECLDGLFNKWCEAENNLYNHNSWINRRAVELACYRIAFVPWKVKPEPSVGVYMETLKSLEKAYGGHPVRFVPADIRDYNRFIGEWRN